MPVIVQF